MLKNCIAMACFPVEQLFNVKLNKISGLFMAFEIIRIPFINIKNIFCLAHEKLIPSLEFILGLSVSCQDRC